MTDDPLGYLKSLGESGSGPHDIARAALMLSILDHADVSLEPCLAHLAEIEAAMRAEAPMILRVGDGARAVAALLAGRLGYEGDRATYDDPRNADLVSVIDRRRGLPVALGILYIHAARAAGMTAAGLDTQGHFLVRFTFRHDDVTVDPFGGGGIVDREHMPLELQGRDAALAQPVGDTDVLLRLQNNLKLRALDRGEVARGREIASRMVLIAPRRPDLWFDLARINEAMGILGAARNAYEHCVELARPGEALHNEAAVALAGLRRRLN
ncbi:MAG TPA: tetratricopeptide repeat protein [Rhizomicrobium sp.]|nr:tetratricopeptide repeat protein [Rhizomicrobium sp.]